MQHNHFSKKILNVSTSDATKFCSTNGLPATHYFNQICGCFQCKFCSINGLPATHYFSYICCCFVSKFCSTNGLPATHYFRYICCCFVSKFWSTNGLPATHYLRSTNGLQATIILAQFVDFKANYVTQTGCRQPIILTKFVAEQILFHKRVAGNPLFSLCLLLFVAVL